MPLKAYRVGHNIVAAYDPADAVAVMERHEPSGQYLAEHVVELLEEELCGPVDLGRPPSIADALERCAVAQLIRWDYRHP